MSGRIYGTVKDTSNNLIATATVTTSPVFSVNMNGGTYFFLTPGAANVNVTASAPNYITQTVPVSVANGGSVPQNFVLLHV